MMTTSTKPSSVGNPAHRSTKMAGTPRLVPKPDNEKHQQKIKELNDQITQTKNQMVLPWFSFLLNYNILFPILSMFILSPNERDLKILIRQYCFFFVRNVL
jgi:hypothetical protein